MVELHNLSILHNWKFEPLNLLISPLSPAPGNNPSTLYLRVCLLFYFIFNNLFILEKQRVYMARGAEGGGEGEKQIPPWVQIPTGALILQPQGHDLSRSQELGT